MAYEYLVEAGELIVKEGDKKFRLTANGPTSLVEAGFEPEVLAGKDAERFKNKVLLDIEENGAKMSKEAKAALHTSFEHLSGAEPKRFNSIKGALDAAKKVEAAASEAELEAALKVKGAVNFVTEAGEKNMEGLKFDLAKFQKAEAALVAKAEELVKARKELTGILTADKKDAKTLQAFMDKNAAHIHDLEPAADDIAAFKKATKFDFGKAKNAMVKEISALATEAETKVGELIKLRDQINVKPENLAELEKQTGVLEKRLGEIGSHKYGSAVRSKLPEELGKELAEVHPSFANTFKVGAAAGDAKEGQGFFKGLLFKNLEKQDALATEKKIARSELKFLQKIHWGKAAGIGAGVVAVGYLAGIGRNTGPGKNAESIELGRNQQLSQGIA